MWRTVPLLLLSRRATSLATSSSSTATMHKLKLLSQKEATELDEDLMAMPGFSIDQLMELAGLSVAAAVLKQYPPSSHPRVLCVCGPGNNGGDGLVAARHLAQFGYTPAVVYPKRPSRPLFVNLAAQMEMMRIPLLDAMPEHLDQACNPACSSLQPAAAPGCNMHPSSLQPFSLGAHCMQAHDLVLDAVFGFSFAGAVRPPFDSVRLRGSIVFIIPPLSAALERGTDAPATRATLCSPCNPVHPACHPCVT